MAQDGGSVLHRRQRLHPTRRRSPHPDQRRGRPPRRPHQNLRVRGDGLFRALVARADFRAKDPSSNPRRRAPPGVRQRRVVHARRGHRPRRGHARADHSRTRLYRARVWHGGASQSGMAARPLRPRVDAGDASRKRRRIRRRVSRPRVRRRHRREGSPPRHGIHVARLRHARRRRGRQGNATEQIRQLRSSPGALLRPSVRGPSVAGRTVAERLQRPRDGGAVRTRGGGTGWLVPGRGREREGRSRR